MPAWLIKVRMFLGKLTSFLLMGRNIGAWNKKPGGFEGDDKFTDNFKL